MMNKKSIYLLLFLIVVGIIYIATMSPNLSPEDSGEIATAVYSLGIPHPPGYPLYLITSKLFSFVPIKSIIFRTNLFSLIFSLLSLLLLIKIIYEYQKNFYIALFTSFLFGISRTFWSQSIITEVYTFNIFLVLLFLIYALKILSNFKHIKFIYFLTGLLIISHYSNALVIIPVWILILYKYHWKTMYPKYSLWFFLPLTLFFYLMIRSISNPLIDWGNPENLHNLVRHILRLSFGSMISKAPRTIITFINQFKLFLKISSMELGTPVGITVLILSILGLKKFKKQEGLLFILLLFFTSVGTILILNFKVDEESLFINRVFFLQFFLIIMIPFAKGIYSLKKLSIPTILTLIIIVFFINVKYNNRSSYNFTLEYNRNLLKSASPNATIFVAKDFTTFPLLYLTKVEYIRPDIKLYDWFGNVFEQIFPFENFHLLPDFKRNSLREKITDNIRKANTNETYYAFQRGTLMETKSLGLIYTFNKNHPDFDLTYYNFPQISENRIKYLDYFVKNMISVYYFHLGYYYKQYKDEFKAKQNFDISDKFGGNKGKYFVNLAVQEMKNKNLDIAIKYLQQAISYDSTLDKAYLYLGNIFYQQNRLIDAAKMYIQCLNINRLNGPAYNNLGNLYLKMGDKEKAIEVFRKGLFTGYGKLFNNISMILIKENRFNEAIDYLKQGIKVAPDNIELYLNLSVALSKINRWEEAGIWLQKAYNISPNNKNILLNLALVNIKLNRLNKARQLLRIGIKMYPDDKRFRDYMSLINKSF